MTDGLKSAVYFDRDGTINEDSGYLSDPGALEMIPGAARSIKKLNDRGVPVVVISNQSGVGRGYFAEEAVKAVNDRLASILSAQGAFIDAIYYCLHRPDEDCECRKPRTGLVDRAAKEHGIDNRRSYVVGDKASDIGLAESAGAKGILVLTGNGAKERDKLAAAPAFVAADINEAVEWIIRDMAAAGR